MIPGIITRDENLSPPLEGCRGGFNPNQRDPPRKAHAFCPSQEGIFRRAAHAARRHHQG